MKAPLAPGLSSCVRAPLLATCGDFWNFLRLLQQENGTSRNFLVRTDALAAKLELNVQDLPDVLGIGRASLFCCRNGSRPITAKTWHKLESAERDAGISEKAEAPVSDPHPPPTPDLHAEIADLKERLGNIETLLERLLEQDTTRTTSSPARGKAG